MMLLWNIQDHHITNQKFINNSSKSMERHFKELLIALVKRKYTAVFWNTSLRIQSLVNVPSRVLEATLKLLFGSKTYVVPNQLKRSKNLHMLVKKLSPKSCIFFWKLILPAAIDHDFQAYGTISTIVSILDSCLARMVHLATYQKV